MGVEWWLPSQTIEIILSSEFKISKMFSNSHDQDICAELRHDIGIDQEPFYFLINNNLSSSGSSMITNTVMDNMMLLPKSKFEMIIWKFQLLFIKLRNKVSPDFFAIDEETRQNKTKQRNEE